MCGIIGQIKTDENIDKDEFLNNLKKLRHRGPDDQGIFIEDNIALGHARLSILDLSMLGHQPMISSCGNFVIVYNGEIYNFKDIKNDLEKMGYNFKSHSDTEVVLNGFIEYREKIVNKLNGMFAFAIYDKKNKSIFFARDRSGIKPLYYWQDKNNFIFSSETRIFKKYSNGINFEAEIFFLLLGYIPEPNTTHKGIFSFPAGHYAYYSNGVLNLKKFNEYSYGPKIKKPYKSIVADVRELLENSIKKQLVSDAPIGVFLSGGLDSSAITAIASQYKSPLQTVSLIFDEKKFNEEHYQDLIVKKYGTNHTKYLIDERIFMETINAFFSSMDQPTIDGLNTFFVSKAAKENGLKTVLSGIGGDEIFYGYPSFSNNRKLYFLSKIPYFLIKQFENSNKYKKLELLKAEKNLSYYLPTRALYTPIEIAKILKIEKSVIFKLILRLYDEYNALNINEIDDTTSYFELNLYMKNQLLKDADMFGMANSIEIRVPFLDNDLTDYVLKIKPKEKFDKNINKVILADAVKDILPKEVIYRSKMGFTLPFENWFKKNIDKFKLDAEVKNLFIQGKLKWAKVWALIILGGFGE